MVVPLDCCVDIGQVLRKPFVEAVRERTHLNKNINSPISSGDLLGNKIHSLMTQSMSQSHSHNHNPLDSRHSLDSCLHQLRTWKPFKLQDGPHPKPYYHKRPCLSDRTTTSFSLDISKLTLADDDTTTNHNRTTNYRLLARKRRRRGSRSVSGRSSDRSGTRRCCSVGASAAYGTCSDFPVAMGTDSSGELFGNGDANWSSDVSEAKNSRRERERENGGCGEKENVGVGFGVSGSYDANGNESGYGSEPGYRGDAEFGYGDEFDEEEDDPRLLFWGDQLGAVDSKREMVGENTLLDQKSHHRCRRRKHDCRMVDALR